MTLITYPTRVHFADGVLEEALHSELERIKGSRVLLVCHRTDAEGELMDRIVGGLPARVSSELVLFDDKADLRSHAYEVAEISDAPDAVISFASAKAIEFGRKIRFAVNSKRGKRPVMFGVPAIDGLPDPCLKKLESPIAGLPAVVICDPTIILAAGEAESRDAAVMSLIRCIESYLSAAYNPPADGIALDGLSRCLNSLRQIGDKAGLDLSRDVMAAGLNAFLSQEKGMGPAQTMTAQLLDMADAEHRAAIARLVLPGTIQARDMDGGKADVLRKVLSEVDEPLADATRRVLASAEMPGTLADLGVPVEALDRAAKAVEGDAGLTFQKARSILADVYEGT